MNDKPRTWLTPPEIAKELRCRTSKPLRWIEDGELPAVNVSSGTRPRYRVRREDLDAFLQRRAVVPVATPPVRKQKREVPHYV